MLRRVLKELRLGLRDVGDPLAVGRPRRRVIFAGIRRDLRQVRAFIRVVRRNHPDVVVVVAVGVGGAVAGEGELLAVGRPDGSRIIVVAAGDLREALGREIEDVKMGAAVVEIPDFVRL